MAKKYEMNIVDEGFEDQTWEKMEKEKERITKESDSEETKVEIFTWRRIIILIVWIALYKLFIHWQFGTVYLFISIFAFIFTNLGERKPWQLSAYSVFNPNFERLPGTMTVGQLQSGLGFGGRPQEDNDEQEEGLQEVSSNNRTHTPSRTAYHTKSEVRKREMKANAKQPLNSVCSCGSGKKYKNCCAKKDL